MTSDCRMESRRFLAGSHVAPGISGALMMNGRIFIGRPMPKSELLRVINRLSLMWTIAPVTAPLHEGFITRYPSLRLRSISIRSVRWRSIRAISKSPMRRGLIWRQT